MNKIMISDLWKKYIEKRRKKQFLLLLVLMIIASIAEIVSLGSIIPFLGILTNPDSVYSHSYAQPVIQFLQISTPTELVMPFTVIFILAILISGLIRLLLLYVTTKLSFAVGADLSINIYRKTLYQEYSVHASRNSSEVINGVINKTGGVVGVIQSYLTLGSSAILITSIVLVLFSINVKVALIASTGFSFFYWVVVKYTRNRLQSNSQCIADRSTILIKALQEGLGGIRDVLIDNSQEFFCQLYKDSDLLMRKASASNVFISNSPRYIMEMIGMTLIVILAYVMNMQSDQFVNIIPMLGVFALGAQKLLPAMQQAYSAYSGIHGSEASFKDVLALLEQPLPINTKSDISKLIDFDQDISINNLSFRYAKNTPYVLKNINLRLEKGSCTGFIGATGSGKSTLIDIIMGLLSPIDGNISIDGEIISAKNQKYWQRNIAHVPQNIYLSDSTIEENIAFGVSKGKINHNKIKKAAECAQISGLIEGWKDGYQTVVGEQGVRLSGGQRQRIGIARALYKKADVLILDEATSALDNETERAVMETIENLGGDLTILIIAHRLTTLKGCDKIISLETNNTIKVLTYEEVMNSNGKQ
jgi:ATP-binding cassette, subfamily B, bacterial PglK